MDLDALIARLDWWAQDKSDEVHERALDAFRTSTHYEWGFWEQAWTRQEWPV